MEAFLLANLSLEMLDGTNENSLILPSRPLPLGQRFGTLEEYLQSFRPLLYLEAFASLSNSFLKEDRLLFHSNLNVNKMICFWIQLNLIYTMEIAFYFHPRR